jgi:hypothetical protein
MLLQGERFCGRSLFFFLRRRKIKRAEGRMEMEGKGGRQIELEFFPPLFLQTQRSEHAKEVKS